jgi:hypothetical protein
VQQAEKARGHDGFDRKKCYDKGNNRALAGTNSTEQHKTSPIM